VGTQIVACPAHSPRFKVVARCPIEGRALYRFSTGQLLANIRILDAVTHSAAADGRPILR
jgi:hypothetical protein